MKIKTEEKYFDEEDFYLYKSNFYEKDVKDVKVDYEFDTYEDLNEVILLKSNFLL